jgi:hypothetical protein
MSLPQENESAEDTGWPSNYFNYFTEIEEHFQRARGTSLFLLSPLDWAIIENWKNGGIPLEAVLRGIDEAFEKWRSRKIKTRRVNSIAYCTQAVLEAAKRLSGAGSTRARKEPEAPFHAEDIRTHLTRSADVVASANHEMFQQIALSLRALAEGADVHVADLENLERHLTVLEDKMVAACRSLASDETLVELRRELDAELSPYRGKMTADQISMLERRYLDTRLLERSGLPRLSLFYLH